MPAHSGIPENEKCDELAKSAASSPDLPDDSGYLAQISNGNNIFEEEND